jgi:hypothetical protein
MNLLKKTLSSLQKLKTEIYYKNDMSNFFHEVNDLYNKDNTFSLNDKIIIECYWDNPGYWFSLSLALNALSASKSNCVAVVSEHKNKLNIIKRLKKLGIQNIICLEDYFSIDQISFDIEKIESEEDLLQIKLPLGFSTNLLYDEFCRYQNSPYVQIEHNSFKKKFYTYLKVILASEKIFKQFKPKYHLTSHNVGVYYGSLANAAIRNKSKILTLYIEQNSLKFLQCKNHELKYTYGSGPTLDDFDNLKLQKKISLRNLGSRYMKNRCAGKVNEASAIYAYNNRKRIKIFKSEIKKASGWNKNYPIITVFSACYMDYQRSWGFNTFMNFLDFNLKTISYLLSKEDIYVIFKQHPANELFANIKEASSSYFQNKFKSKNLIIADVEWDNKSLIKLSSGVITPDGTVGIEATHLEKPVLCANKGYYGHIGFVNYAKSKSDFFKLIDKKFWNLSKPEIQINKERSDEFSGWYYSNPIHSELYKVPDTTYGHKLYKILKEWTKDNKKELHLEISCLKKWLVTNDFSYHAWKIKNKNWD